MVAASVEG